MKKEMFEEILEKLKIEKEKIFLMRDIDSIILENGVGIYPNWSHMRFLITDKDDILIQHGSSEPYGGRLSSNFQIKVGYRDLLFSSPNPIIDNEFTNTKFRLPRSGDILCIYNSEKKIIDQTIITSVSRSISGFYLSTATPLKLDKNSLLSFYDPSMYDADTCVHGSEEPGIFLKYTPNFGKKVKNYGIFQEIIHLKDIKEIKLSLKSKNTYSIS